jgi:hypothetical protein
VLSLCRTDDLGDTLSEGDAAPLGELLRRLVITRHVLGSFARQGANQPGFAAKVVATIVHVHTVAVARQHDIGAVAVHTRCGERRVRSTVTAWVLWIVAA